MILNATNYRLLLIPSVGIIDTSPFNINKIYFIARFLPETVAVIVAPDSGLANFIESPIKADSRATTSISS
jgi:hypothetical protein